MRNGVESGAARPANPACIEQGTERKNAAIAEQTLDAIMKSIIWFRALAVVLGLFTLGHTVGTVHAVTDSPQEAAVISAMQGHRVPVMGFLRTYWEFYRGFSISITVLLATLMVIAWQLGSLARRNPREALPRAVTLLVACVGQAIVCFIYFFTAPMILSTLSVILAGVGVALTAREARLADEPRQPI
jgi:hypothetical protein